MKVLKPGNIVEIDIRHTCKKCGCIFEYNKSDISHDQRDGDYVICPTCKQFINVTYSNEAFKIYN